MRELKGRLGLVLRMLRSRITPFPLIELCRWCVLVLSFTMSFLKFDFDAIGLHILSSLRIIE